MQHESKRRTYAVLLALAALALMATIYITSGERAQLTPVEYVVREVLAPVQTLSLIHILSLSQAKAQHVAGSLTDKVIIAADTVVVLEDEILGKPENEDAAFGMLTLLAGCWHHVVTGVTVLDTYAGASCSSYEVTGVRMKELSPGAITAYVESGEPLGKAGAYACLLYTSRCV